MTERPADAIRGRLVTGRGEVPVVNVTGLMHNLDRTIERLRIHADELRQEARHLEALRAVLLGES